MLKVADKNVRVQKYLRAVRGGRTRTAEPVPARRGAGGRDEREREEFGLQVIHLRLAASTVELRLSSLQKCGQLRRRISPTQALEATGKG